MQENTQVLEYKNFHLFYRNLYTRLFNLINNVIDEKHYSIINIKNELQDFLDSYSYYILQKKLITKEEQEKGLENEDVILNNLKSFDTFTDTLKTYPSVEYVKCQQQAKELKFNMSKLSQESYNLLLREYYSFFNKVLQILNKFIFITSENGFLPNIKNRTALKTIGFANYDLFFQELEMLKLKMSSITSSITIKNIFHSRRCVFSVLVIFSPYFTKYGIFDKLVLNLDFKFIKDDEKLRFLRNALGVNSLEDLGKETANVLKKDILNPLKENISLIKRYISYEFGERDLNPRITRKYGYDPTGV
jgi:hypothetical protein